MPAADMEVEEIGHGTMTHPVRRIADRTAGDQAEANRLRPLLRSRGPDEEPSHDHQLDSGEQQWAIEEDLTEHPEADTRVEPERQIKKWHDFDGARGYHHGVDHQPFRHEIDH